MTIIHWFRRDLRLRQNESLAAALAESNGAVLPVFVLDEALLGAGASARVRFLLGSLAALDRDLRAHDSRLVVRRGRPVEVLVELCAATSATAVYWNRDYTPFARSRDAAVEGALASHGVLARSFADVAICGPDALLSSSSTPYTVFTPYWRRWREAVKALPPARESLPTSFAPLPESLDSLALPAPGHLAPAADHGLPPPGEAAGRERLVAFCGAQGTPPIDRYHEQRDLLALPATSRLSPYLRFGCVPARSCLDAALAVAVRADAAREGVEAWLRELAWRDFYVQVVYHHPHVLRRAFRRAYDALVWENDPDLFAAWCAGSTGYPIVDAAMRQLHQEAWMHNRARMIVASFLTKDLLIDWRWGERYFMQHLVDGDPAANNGGWQWAAGTGTDAQPYFRIFNPTSQGATFDPDGAYVRRYLPELASVPNQYIHRPWEMPEAHRRQIGLRLGRDYPLPIVDHQERRARALAMFQAVRSGSDRRS